MTLITFAKRAVPLVVFIGIAFAAHQSARADPGANFDKSVCPSAAYSAPCTLLAQSLNTFELNAGVNWKWLS